MRNKYPGKCYRCGQPVGPGDGHYEPHGTSGRVRHDGCEPKTLLKPITTYIEKSGKDENP